MGLYTGFPGGSVVKNSPANAGDAGDMDSVPGSGRSPGAGNGHYSSILAWEIPRTETGGLQSMGLQSHAACAPPAGGLSHVEATARSSDLVPLSPPQLSVRSAAVR